jgi:hypothetical protein
VNRGSRRHDAQATQKISRAQLDEALKRTKSGTRRAIPSDPALGAPEEIDFLGPRDDSGPLVGHIEDSTSSPLAAAPAHVAEDASADFTRPKPARTPESVALTKLAALAEAARTSEPEPLAFVVPEDEAEAGSARDRTLRVQPRTAFLFGLAIAALVVLAALVGYLAGHAPPR